MFSYVKDIIVDDYKRVGCVKDLISGRILREKAGKLKPNSPWNCQKFCAGYRYFGVEVRIYLTYIMCNVTRVYDNTHNRYEL